MRRLFGLSLLPFTFLLLNFLSTQTTTSVNGFIIRASNNQVGSVANGRSWQPDISRDGQFIVFESEATDLIGGDTNGEGDIYLFNRGDGTLSRISEPANGSEPNGWSRNPVLSASGRYVAFTSNADNLVTGDINTFYDIFVYDQVTAQLRLVSVASDGTPADLFSYNPAISADGRFIAYGSYATNLTTPAPGPFNQWQVYLHDRDPDGDTLFDEPGQILTIPISISSNGDFANNFAGFTGRLAVSDDGMIIAFVSAADNLVANDTNGVDDVFVHLRDPDNDNIPDEPGQIETIRISVSSSGTQGNARSFDVQMSADGEWLVFNSEATNFVTGDTNNREDVFLHNRTTGETTRVSVSSSGAENPGGGVVPDISANGRYITFHANNSNLTNPTCLSMLDCVYRHDRLTGITELVTFDPNGTPSAGHTYQPAISGDGHRIAFLSENGFLVDNSSNLEPNVYLWTSFAALTHQVYVPTVMR